MFDSVSDVFNKHRVMLLHISDICGSIGCRSVARETQGDGNPPHSTPAPIAAIPRNHRISLLHC